ncbi:unnamed protein product [Zymoseptoria tritici ST99CH_3D1]|nr:unnamed protein product [Zymoseptoria tritici ST99CH_3D1]
MADGAFFSQTATWLGKPDTYGTTRRFMYSMPSANPKPVMRIVFGLIGVNAAVFGAWHYAIAYRDHRLLRTMNAHFKLSETNLKEGRYHTLITSAFSHTDFRHILFNMFGLYTFGSIISRVPGVGGLHIMGIVLGSAFAGSAATVYQKSKTQPRISRDRWLNSSRTAVIRHTWEALGASGSVMGLAAAATCLSPFNKMVVLPIPIPMPLWVLMIAYVGLDTYYMDSGSKTSSGNIVGHTAHLGGFAFGFLYYLFQLRNRGGLWSIVRSRSRR